ncbi:MULTISPECIES: hypothetical protein [Cyanophyceae]|uniref:Uncharacterized protein n=1 Tax=Leptolyngbya subtilissima DQ-A4 TaxID=2933933 RepID=A0ABV0K173_9CYAN|nr:hypothetical protein [Nodosilinea sp. FACHB-141]MBD2111190.1 hypothetical protein [Nodosilinea sp. FACHB-141]
MVSPVISRPALNVSPPPSPRPRSALLRQGWRLSLPWSKNSAEGRSLLLKHPQMWGLGLGSLALGLVNGALVISAGIGLVAYQQILQLSPRQRKGLMQRLQQGLPLPSTPQQQALMLGLVTGVSTYTFTALWHNTHSLLMALLLTGQGALALFAVGALLRSSRSTERSDDLWDAAPVTQVDHNLGLLSHPDPLKRLVAVRRLVRLAQGNEEYLVGMSVRSHLLDCFQIRLGQESDAIVRSALEEGQSLLRSAKPLPPSSSAAFVVDFASDAAELKQPELEPQFVAAPDISESLKPSELGHLEASPEQIGLEQHSSSALEKTPEASTTTPTRASESAPKGRRTVEYVEYLDI